MPINNNFMKKIFVFLISALTLGVSSCSDNGDGPSKPSTKMLLTGIESTYSDGSVRSVFSDFTYDSDGKILSYKVSNGSSDADTYTYSYSSSSIVRKCDGKSDGVYSLSNGKITATNSDDKYSYTGNQLTKWVEDDSYSIIYTWENGNPIRETVKYGNGDDYITNYTYNDSPCYIGFLTQLKKAMNTDIMGGSAFDPFLQQCGFYGDLPRNLVSGCVIDGVEWTLDYEFNNNGYPTKIIGKDEDGDIFIIMTLTWK